jgi:spore maturation protein CgeB
MRFVIFTHSLVSDWNHGNAHFLRGIATDLLARGHTVHILEPRNGWSRTNLMHNDPGAVADFEKAYPQLSSSLYDLETLDLNHTLAGADVVIVHEWNPPELVAKIGQHRARRGDYRLFFHDTHHRSVTEPDSMGNYELSNYDGVLAYGNAIRDIYRKNGWAPNAWTWHEAADTRVFRPRPAAQIQGDVVWIGNWGDDERASELREFLIEPVKRLHLKARVYGVRYPKQALSELADAGIEYGGWLPNFRVPEVFAQFRITIHVPRRPYARALTGIPTIRPFEALACKIPLISAPWEDTEHLFHPGRDFLFARDQHEMTSHLRAVLSDEHAAASLARHGLATIQERHTCSHRVDQLLALTSELAQTELSQTVI